MTEPTHSPPPGFSFKTEPFPHQLEEWELFREAPERALLWEQGCVSPDTELLTQSGWVPVTDICRAGPRVAVAAWNPDTGAVSYQKPTATKTFPAPTGVRIFKPGVTDQLVSVTHRCPHAGERAGDTASVTLAQDLLAGYRPPLPLDFTLPGGTGERLSEASVRFRAIDSLLARPYRIGSGTLEVRRAGTRMLWANVGQVDHLKTVLTRARVSFDVSSVTDPEDNTEEFLITYPKPAGDAPVCPSWYNFDLNQLNHFLTEALWCMGAGRCIATNRKPLVDFIQYAAASTGRGTRIRRIGASWQIKVNMSAMPPKVTHYEVTPEPIPGGKVYAVTVPQGFLLYRRNGLIFPSGNCGKSKPTVDTANYLYRMGKIDAVIVLAPNGVHRNWIEGEVPDHTPDDVMGEVFGVAFSSEKAGTKRHQKLIHEAVHHRGLSWLAMAYESFTTKHGHQAISDFLQYRKVLYVADEAHRIKSPDSPRVKSILKSSRYAPYRRVLTGTPVAVGPFDLYTQMKFLDNAFWKKHGLSTFAEFKRHFAVFDKGYNPNIVRWERDPVTGKSVQKLGGEYPVLKAYRRLDELQAVLKLYASRKTKAEVLPDLPPKRYARKVFQLTPEQHRMYHELSAEFQTWVRTQDLGSTAPAGLAYQTDMFCETCHGSGEIEEEGYIYPCPVCGHGATLTQPDGTAVFAELAIVRISMLQMITSGFIPTKEAEEPVADIPGPNPRLEALLEVLREIDTPVIVWARYRREVDMICAALKSAGITFGRYDGAVDEAGRAETKARFQGFRAVYDSAGALVGREDVPDHQRVRVFVGNPAAGSTGLTLTAARTVIYYSNSFKLIDRLQSEDRAHRIGQKYPVDYVDLEADQTVDRMIVKNLLDKFNIAAAITGDNLMEWIK